MSYEVIVIKESEIKDLHHSVEHWSFQDYEKAVAKFHQLCAIHDWVELKDEDAYFNDHDGLGLCFQRD